MSTRHGCNSSIESGTKLDHAMCDAKTVCNSCFVDRGLSDLPDKVDYMCIVARVKVHPSAEEMGCKYGLDKLDGDVPNLSHVCDRAVLMLLLVMDSLCLRRHLVTKHAFTTSAVTLSRGCGGRKLATAH